MLNEKQKIRIHKLVLEIEKKKKQISTKAILNYIEIKESRGMTFTLSDIKKKVYENVYKEDNDKDKEKNLIIQNKLLDEVLSSDTKMRIIMYALRGVGVILTVSIFIWIISPSEKNARIYTKKDDRYGAWAYTQIYVQKLLKSPQSADFRFGGYRDVTYLGDNSYSFDSYVDALNPYGVKMRTYFTGTIRRISGGWSIETFSFKKQ